MKVDQAPPARETILVGQVGMRYLVDGSATGDLAVLEWAVSPSSNDPPLQQ